MCLSRSASEKLLQESLVAAKQAAMDDGSSQAQQRKLSSEPTTIRSPLSSNGTSCQEESLEDDENSEAHVVERLRWREFSLAYVAYMGFLACRKNYGLWLPAVVSELGHSKGQAGMLGSSLEFTYGACSFLNGVVIDTMPAKHLLIAGLVLSAIANVCIANTDSLGIMIALWTANGAVQSVGWPSITNVFLAWFPDPAQRGAWYSLLSTCQNAGAALIPLCVSAFVSSHGWRAALLAPAAASAATALLLGVALHGSPQAATGSAPSTKAKPSKADLAHTMRQQVFLNHRLWLMAIGYFGVSMVRTCIQDWTSLYLLEAKGLPMATAARCLFLWELGGFGGSLVAGALSDRLFRGRRGPVVCLSCALLAPSLVSLSWLTSPTLLQLNYFWLGVCAFPVHVLLGLFSREVVPPSVSSSAGGFVKMIAQIGGASAGSPMGRLQQAFGWNGVLAALAMVSLTSAAASLPLWHTTAAIRIAGRNGTVQDFNSVAMQRKASKSKLS
mmetsp:Transcript_3853/g.10056  ORF Transcript_3853/g.10056 Transcript_3853/m.10056 type:complete len:500 (+) Transcript_3853:54-1553(+)